MHTRTVGVGEPVDLPFQLPVDPDIGQGEIPHSGEFRVILTYQDIAGLEHRTDADVSWRRWTDYLDRSGYNWTVMEREIF
jgi:hypothetical protein